MWNWNRSLERAYSHFHYYSAEFVWLHMFSWFITFWPIRYHFGATRLNCRPFSFSLAAGSNWYVTGQMFIRNSFIVSQLSLVCVHLPCNIITVTCELSQDTEMELRSLQHKQESFVIQYQESLKISSKSLTVILLSLFVYLCLTDSQIFHPFYCFYNFE